MYRLGNFCVFIDQRHRLEAARGDVCRRDRRIDRRGFQMAGAEFSVAYGGATRFLCLQPCGPRRGKKQSTLEEEAHRPTAAARSVIEIPFDPYAIIALGSNAWVFVLERFHLVNDAVESEEGLFSTFVYVRHILVG